MRKPSCLISRTVRAGQRARTYHHALVAQYRHFASDYRRLAAILTKPDDKQALELLAIGWDRIAEKREAMLRSKERAQRPTRPKGKRVRKS